MFSLLFLLVTVTVYSQSIPNGYIDTVQVKYDKKKGTLTVERKDFKTKYFTFKVKSINDSLQVSPGTMDSMLKVINRFSANKPIRNDELLQKLHDTTSQGFFLLPGEDGPKLGPPGGPSNEGLNEQLAEKEEQITYFKYCIAILILLSLILLVWGIITGRSKRKIQRKQQKDLKDELLGLLKKHFEKGIVHAERRNLSPDELLSKLAAEQKDVEGKLYNLEQLLAKAQDQLSDKNEELDEYDKKIKSHKEELEILDKKYKDEQSAEKERINNLCAKMIERKDLFVNSLSGLEVNLSRKELIRFSFAYAEMAVSVLDEIRGKNSESGKLNIRLLNGSKENFGKTFDQHSPEDAIDREYILMAKIFSDLGIESIEDVYFNGDKFQQKK